MVMSRFFCIKMQNKCWPSGPSSCCGRSLEYTFSKTTQNLLGSLWNMSSAFHMFPFQIHGDVRKYKVASPRKGCRSPGEIPFPTWLKFALFHKKSWVLNRCRAVDCCFNAHYTLMLQRTCCTSVHCILVQSDFHPLLDFFMTKPKHFRRGTLCSPCKALPAQLCLSMLHSPSWIGVTGDFRHLRHLFGLFDLPVHLLQAQTVGSSGWQWMQIHWS